MPAYIGNQKCEALVTQESMYVSSDRFVLNEGKSFNNFNNGSFQHIVTNLQVIFLKKKQSVKICQFFIKLSFWPEKTTFLYLLRVIILFCLLNLLYLT